MVNLVKGYKHLSSLWRPVNSHRRSKFRISLFLFSLFRVSMHLDVIYIFPIIRLNLYLFVHNSTIFALNSTNFIHIRIRNSTNFDLSSTKYAWYFINRWNWLNLGWKFQLLSRFKRKILLLICIVSKLVEKSVEISQIGIEIYGWQPSEAGTR